jgi:DNA-directed RNA polymerase delta subunit
MVIKNFSPYKIVKEVISELKPNEVKVILGRFGIDTSFKTLSAIGKDLKLSRERIRQIEREGLKKLAKAFVAKNSTYIDQIVESFEKGGGITSHEKITEKFLEETYQKNVNEFNSLHLILSLMPQIMRIEKTKELESGWMLASLSKDDAIKIINEWAKHLELNKKPETIDVLVDNHPHQKKYKVAFLSELPHISKKLVKTETGFVGLSTWPEVNPRNVRDKIYYILKKIGKPMHFDEIAKKIMSQGFDGKKIVKATVHNELIADDRFVLVGRGIYALKEWGYESGTVADIIKGILKNKSEGLTSEKIVEAVLKQRLVKRNTILINLQTKPFFKKINKDKYVLV